MFTCKRHWSALPAPFQKLIWKHYRPGQENDKDPSPAYMAVQSVSVGVLAFLEGRSKEAEGCFHRAKLFLALAPPDVGPELRAAYIQARGAYGGLSRDQAHREEGSPLPGVRQENPQAEDVCRHSQPLEQERAGRPKDSKADPGWAQSGGSEMAGNGAPLVQKLQLFRRPLVIVDTETTGLLRSPWARPIEIAVVIVDVYGQEARSWSSLVHEANVPAEADHALKINGITREEIASAPPRETALSAFLSWAGGEAPGPATSFNRPFDQGMLDRLAWPLSWSTQCVMLRACETMSADPNCTIRRMKNGRIKWPTLGEAAAYFGVPQNQPAHRALADARTAAGVAVAISRKKLESR